ncbi:MAG: hypothetical protein OR994_03065 [Candidatus Poseidoniales archaeon]|nr:hypothetical protein [Candidatus Poseidoniales archaeon]
MKAIYSKQVLSAIAILMLLSIMFPVDNETLILENDNRPMNQLGGGGTLEEQCSSITFEDLFEYTHAHFDIVINEDWDSAEVEARAWVNGSIVDTLRESLDSFLDELYPSGGDGWISTDERSAVEAVASECIEYALTRIGIRESSPHRGGVGLDWKNATWEDNGVLIQEWNLVPPNHAEIRDCTTIGSSSDCVEVPVYPNSERDCDILIENSEGVDECRLELWMNATMVIPSVNQGDEFTLAFNASNMTNAVLEFTFPNNPDLRLDMWEECEGRDVEFEPTTHADAPFRGTCIGDSSSTYIFENIENERAKYILTPHRSRDIWPSGEDIFADFTTSAVPIDEPPTWTENAPNDGFWFPSFESGERVWADWESVSSWFTDEKPISQLQINCEADDTMNIYQAADKSFWGIIQEEETKDVTCEAIDSLGQSSGNRTWHLGIPISVSTSSNSLSNPHPIIINLNEGWPELTVEYGFTQTQNVHSENIGTTSIISETTLMVESTGIVPGLVHLWIRTYGENVYSIDKIFTLGITKESAPPLISISEYGWEADTWKAQGQFSDPDGEEVVFSLSIDSLSTGSISVSGNSWSTPIINFGLWDEGEHEVKIVGCDISMKCNEVIVIVNNTHLFENEVLPSCHPCPSPDEETGILPGPSIVLTILSLTIGLIYSTRRD